MATCKCKSVCAFSGSQSRDIVVVSAMLSVGMQEHISNFVAFADLTYKKTQVPFVLESGKPHSPQ